MDDLPFPNRSIVVADHEEVQERRKEGPVGKLVQEHSQRRRHLSRRHIQGNISWKVSAVS